MGGRFRSGRSSWDGTPGLSSSLPIPPDPPPLDRGGTVSASLPLDRGGGRLPESSPFDRRGKFVPSSPRNPGGRLPASPPRDLGGLLPASLPLDTGRLNAASSLLLVEIEAASESWLILLGASLRNGAGWLPIRLDSTLEAGDGAPLGGIRRGPGGGWGVLAASGEPAPRRLLCEDIFDSPERGGGGVVSAVDGRTPGGGLREPRT